MVGHPVVLAELAERIARQGSIRFDEFMDVALYHPDGGFFAGAGPGGAGRRGADFVTSPEVGPLFGAVVARYLDARWHELGRPDPFVVVEAAAGRGALAIAVLAAAPDCAPALRYVLVERSEGLRARQHDHLAMVHPFEVLGPEHDPEDRRHAVDRSSGPLVCGLSELPVQQVDGVVLANELLDNLAFRLVQRTEGGWAEVRVTRDPSDDSTVELVELLVPADGVVAARATAAAPDAATGLRIPLQEGAGEWLRDALAAVRSGSVLVIDYAATSAELAGRPIGDWLRTYRSHERGGAPLLAPGSQDITCEVAVDQLARVRRPTSQESQRAWLHRFGIEDLVEEGRRIWRENASAPDLATFRAQSRIVEAEALTAPTGLGAFQVLEWCVEPR